jgi:hypothetical protein
MHRWCLLSLEVFVERGGFWEAQLITHSGRAVEQERELLEELATRLMSRYESAHRLQRTFVIGAQILQRPFRTKRFYRELFDDSGAYTERFVTWASESLVLWVEQSFGETAFSEAGGAGQNWPGYDVVSVLEAPPSDLKLRLVQVKATRDRLTQEAHVALTKFGRLERGDYDPAILDHLSILRERGHLPDDMIPGEIVYAHQWQYRIAVIHGEPREDLQILTTYDRHIPGDARRRRVHLIRVVFWPSLWKILADIVYAQLA